MSHNYIHPTLLENESKTGRFLSLSAIVHVGAAIAMTMMTFPLTEPVKTETISIELGETMATPTQGAAESATAAAPVAVEKVDKADDRDEVIVPEKPVIAKLDPTPKPLPTPKSMTKAKSTPTHAPPPRAAHAAPPAAAKIATIDDIDAPEVETATDEMKHSWQPAAYGESLDEDLQNEDNKQAQVEAAEREKIDQEAKAFDVANEAALAQAEANTKAEAAAMTAASEARRAREAKAIADARAQETAAIARQQAADEREAAAAAALAAKNDRGTGNITGDGAGAEGSPQAGPTAGEPNGVRSLDQLRQMPNNPLPQYSNRERLARQQGQVTFYAYVKKDGSLGAFKQAASTGYANLDSKTLAALQQWRFYPGQEGWVELPFKWDLHGGATSVDGLLRTKRSDLAPRE